MNVKKSHYTKLQANLILRTDLTYILFMIGVIYSNEDENI